MSWLPHLFALIVAIEHVYIMILEMFPSKTTQKVFNLEEHDLNNPRIKTLFANQGLYNGFLAAGILWGLFFVPEPFQAQTIIFFVSCVMIAAIYGAFTSQRSILLKQGLPAILTIILYLL